MKKGGIFVQALVGLSILAIVTLAGLALRHDDLILIGDGFTAYRPGLWCIRYWWAC